MRIRSGIEFLIPMASDCSRSLISGAINNSVKIAMIEDWPKSRKFTNDIIITQGDMKWILSHNYESIIFISDNPQFNIAVESLSTFNQQASPRMCIATLWAGNESIFGIQSELRFRLATEISVFLNQGEKSEYLFIIS